MKEQSSKLLSGEIEQQLADYKRLLHAFHEAGEYLHRIGKQHYSCMKGGCEEAAIHHAIIGELNLFADHMLLYMQSIGLIDSIQAREDDL